MVVESTFQSPFPIAPPATGASLPSRIWFGEPARLQFRLAVGSSQLSHSCLRFASARASACLLPGRFELLSYAVSGLEVHLVRHLPTERRVRQSSIVFLHVVPHQLLDSPDCVECVQVQPLVFEHSPPGFNDHIMVPAAVRSTIGARFARAGRPRC